MNESRPAAFLDRDGVINRDLGHVHRIADFELLPGALDGARLLREAGYALVVVTNQAGIARGLYSPAQYRRLTRHMLALFAQHGAPIAAIYHCPHHPQAALDALRRDCDCRKPRPGLLLQAAREHRLDLAHSVLVGDKRSDIEAGRAAGVGRTVIVRCGHALTAADIAAADACRDDLFAAAQWLLEQGRAASP